MEGYFKVQNCHYTEEKLDTHRQNEGTRKDEKIVFSNVFEQFFTTTLPNPDRYKEIICEVKNEQPSVEDDTEISFTDVHNQVEEIKEELDTKYERINSFIYQNDKIRDDIITCACKIYGSSCLGRFARLKQDPVNTEVSQFETVPLEVNNEDLKIEPEELIIKDEVTLDEGRSSSQKNVPKSICICKTKKNMCGRCNSRFHVVSTEPVVYQCKLCPYRGTGIRAHMLRHLDISEVRKVYQCDSCEFQTKHKNSINYHQLTHKTKEEANMHECAACDFRTKHLGNLKRHSVIHKSKTDVKMYKCTSCDFETKHIRNLRGHALKHKDLSEIPFHKCPSCHYKTKSKYRMKMHMATHMKPQQTYRCTERNFWAHYPHKLRRLRSVVHESPSAVRTYPCTEKHCRYVTKKKSYLKQHLLTHNRGYWCKHCGFRSQFKGGFKFHKLVVHDEVWHENEEAKS